MSNRNAEIWDTDPNLNTPDKQAAQRPLWTLSDEDLEPGDALLNWCEGRYALELKRYRDYRLNALRNLALYKGRHDFQGKNSNSLNLVGYKPPKPAKLIVNYMQDIVTQRVSRAIKNKPSVIISPANHEYSDQIAAKVVKAWADYQLYRQDFDGIVTKVLTAAYIMGEAYISTCWDPSAGNIHPDWRQAVIDAKRLGSKPRVEIRDNDGSTLVVDQPYYVGDVAFQDRTPLNTLVELTGRFDKANYVIFEDLEDLDELKVLYPAAAEKLSADDKLDSWSGIIEVSETELSNKVLTRTLYWRGSDFMPEGRYIKWTKSAVLVSKPLPAQHTCLPITRFTDIDLPNEQRGMSFFQHGRNLNAAINDLTTIGRRNAIQMGSPKWAIPRGSKIKREALGNDITLVEYDGPQPPHIITPPPMSTETMSLRQQLLSDMQNIMGASQFSQADSGVEIRSALQMQIMDEQDEQRANSGVAKYSSLIRESVKAAIATAASYYEPEDKRLLPIVGKDMAPELSEFDIKTLTRDYDIRVSSNTGLPAGKGQRAQVLAELKQAFPTAIPDAMVLDMMEFGDSQRYFDITTAAVRAADAENEEIMSGGDISPPVPYEGLSTHWQSHVAAMQKRSYKLSVPVQQKSKLENHLLVTEQLMLESAKKNPVYAVELAKLQNFPILFSPSEQDFILLDRARTGTPLTLSEVDVLYKTGQLPQPPVAPANVSGAGGEQGGRPPNMSATASPEEGAPSGTVAQSPADQAITNPM